jgi:NADPH-dependent 2,4-dienoyl-CoA reductase/sulfur reductase-like enzyme
LRRVLAAVRDAVSPGFAVGVRLSDSADARILAMSEVAIVAARLQHDALADYVNMSYGDYYALHRQVGGMDAPTGFQIPHTAPAVAGLRLPRLLNGRFRTLEEVEQVLRAGDADLISMVRAHIADPDIVAKSVAGHPERVRPCIACNQGCIGRTATLGRLGCVVNTAAGDEGALAEALIAPSPRPMNVLVVGGGPAGMEAARIAALGGHRATLAEAAPRLGGLTSLYRHAPRMGTIGDIAGWLEQEIYRLGVEVRLSTYLEAADILAEGADTVIVATGAELEAPLRQVQFPADPVVREPGARIVSSIELFADRGADWGRRAAVVDEVGHYEAIACAEYLLTRGAAVTFVTRHKMFAPAIDITLRTQSALERLHGLADFTLRTGSHVAAIRRGAIDVRPQFGGRIETFPADTTVWVPIRQGQVELPSALEAAGAGFVVVGDALAGRNLQTAIREGHLAARALSLVTRS